MPIIREVEMVRSMTKINWHELQGVRTTSVPFSFAMLMVLFQVQSFAVFSVVLLCTVKWINERWQTRSNCWKNHGKLLSEVLEKYELLSRKIVSERRRVPLRTLHSGQHCGSLANFDLLREKGPKRLAGQRYIFLTFYDTYSSSRDWLKKSLRDVRHICRPWRLACHVKEQLGRLCACVW